MPNRSNPTTQETTTSMRGIDVNNFQVATTKTAREINRRVVLNLIRKHQPISRADLSRRSRLQRSTVSAITGQLIAERWVTMGAYGDLPRGRKPAFLHLNGARAGIVGIDIGPVETKIVLADLDMRFLTHECLPTSRDPKQFVMEVGGRLRDLMTSYSHIAFEGIGVALPGRVDLPSNRLVFAPNLAWEPIDLKKPLEEVTGLPVELENAANACALAEFWGGHHPESVRNLIAVTVSEDVGVGMILNGQLVRGTTGVAGEFGHVTIQENGSLCKCGNRGCFEVCASNTAAVRYFNESVLAKSPPEAPGETTFDFILKMAELGDRRACESLERMSHFLGVGLAMMICGLAPDVIVVIGEITRAWKQVGPVVNETVSRRLSTKAMTRILPGASGVQSRLRGAIAVVLQKHFGAFHCI